MPSLSLPLFQSLSLPYFYSQFITCTYYSPFSLPEHNFYPLQDSIFSLPCNHPLHDFTPFNFITITHCMTFLLSIHSILLLHDCTPLNFTAIIHCTTLLLFQITICICCSLTFFSIQSDIQYLPIALKTQSCILYSSLLLSIQPQHSLHAHNSLITERLPQHS